MLLVFSSNLGSRTSEDDLDKLVNFDEIMMEKFHQLGKRHFKVITYHTLLDFFLLGYLNGKVYSHKLSTILELNDQISKFLLRFNCLKSTNHFKVCHEREGREINN